MFPVPAVDAMKSIKKTGRNAGMTPSTMATMTPSTRMWSLDEYPDSSDDESDLGSMAWPEDSLDDESDASFGWLEDNQEDFDSDAETCVFSKDSSLPPPRFHESRYTPLEDAFVCENEPAATSHVLKRSHSFSYITHEQSQAWERQGNGSIQSSRATDVSPDPCMSFRMKAAPKTAEAFILLDAGEVEAAQSVIMDNFMSRGFELEQSYERVRHPTLLCDPEYKRNGTNGIKSCW